MHGRVPFTGLLSVALLCVALTGCSGDEAPSESPQPESESHSAPETLEEVQAQVNAEYDEVKVNLNEADPRYGAELMEQATPALDLVSLVELSMTLKDERTTITHASGGGRGITDERLEALEQVAEIVDEVDHEEVRIDNTPRGIAVSATFPEVDVWIGEQVVEVLRPLDLTHSPVLLSSTDQPTESILCCTARSGCQ